MSKSIPPLAPLDLSQRYTIPEAVNYLRIGRAYLYERIAKGEIRCVVDGRRRYVPGTEIARLSALPATKRA